MEELYLCYESLMFKIAFQYTHNRGDAEDIVNDSVVRLLSKLHELREMPEKAHARYIELTVRSVAIDAHRGKKREERRGDRTAILIMTSRLSIRMMAPMMRGYFGSFRPKN